jgi:hypothetical protein
MAWQFGCPVSELVERLSASEFTSWIALFKIRADEHQKAMKR